MRRKIKKVARPKNARSRTAVRLPLILRGLLATLTLPTLISGCAHREAAPPSQEGLASSPKKIIFHARKSPAAPRDVGAFDVDRADLNALPPADYLIVEEIVSRRAKIAEIERLERERNPAPVENDAKARRKARIIERLRRDRLGASKLAKGNRFPINEKLRFAEAVQKSASPPGRSVPVSMPNRSWVAAKGGRDAIWNQVRNNLMLASVEHERVDAQIEEFRRHPGRVTYLAQRAQPYLPHIVGELGRRGLPADLVLVPMVESGFEPTALSPKAAAGIWQIIPSTGVEHGLVVSESYDGRYDVHESTKAALSYLRHLSTLFRGDWLLALAAYNCGEGAVQRAIAANLKAGKGTSFWELELPAETRAYVPKIVALARLFADPTAAALPVRRGGGSPYSVVELAPGTRLVDAVAAAGMSPDEFFRMNPAFKPDVDPPQRNYSILLPEQNAKTLAANLPGAKFLGTQTIVVQKGDTLAKIAKRAGVSKLKLAQWNGLAPDTALTPGQELLVNPA
jgi:membrane-bound lytic murein transglycosylase D